MRSGPSGWTRALAAAAILATASAATVATEAAAATSGDDTAIARAGLLVAADLPGGFVAKPSSETSHAATIRLAKGVDGCKPYVTLQKAVSSLPEASSPRFDDGTRTVENEVDVFPSERAAVGALRRYAKNSVVGCLENLFEKQLRRDPDLEGDLDDVVVDLDRQDIAGLGDDSVVYEGGVVITATDGSRHQVGVGLAAVRVGRAVDAVSYTTEGGALTDVLEPAIDASVARLRAALAQHRT